MKIRKGFVSNSSSSSFIIERVNFGDSKKLLISKDVEKKIKKFGFEKTFACTPYQIGLDGWKYDYLTFQQWKDKLTFGKDKSDKELTEELNRLINKNKPISRQRAFQIVRKLAEEVGINNVGGKQPHPHHFRHTYAIDQARNMKSPADVRKLQMTMDHSSLAVTEQYLKFSDEEIKLILQPHLDKIF
jgi:integrase